MIFSLPSYRRLSEADLDRLRRDDGRHFSNRVARVLLNLLLLAGLWGIPLYARWILLEDVVGTESLPKALLGKWKDNNSVLEFTAEEQVRLFREEAMIETADYRILGDMLEVSDFTRQPGDRLLSVNPQHYRITIHDDQLTVTPATVGFTPILEKSGERSALRWVLPPFSDRSVKFRRRTEH